MLYISEAGPETLPTTATGPDPGRDPLYGEATLTPGFAPAPFALQITGGGRSRAADFIALENCPGYVSEAPDFSLVLGEDLREIWLALHSPAEMMLLVNDAQGAWHCSADGGAGDPTVYFSPAWSGLYDIWIGSVEERNYAASIFYASESEPDGSLEFNIDTSCPSVPDTDLQVGTVATVTAAGAVYDVPETASAIIYQAPVGSALPIVGGPICDDAYRWWRVQLSESGRGWMRDGDSASSWLTRQE